MGDAKASAPNAAPVNVEKVNVRLLTVNDVYTYLPSENDGGFLQLGTLLKRYRADDSGSGKDRENTMFICQGDFLGGSALSERFAGSPAIEVLNALRTDLVVIGK